MAYLIIIIFICSDVHAAERQHPGRHQEPEVLPQTRGARQTGRGRTQRQYMNLQVVITR
jgi:hypothetical protein